MDRKKPVIFFKEKVALDIKIIINYISGSMQKEDLLTNTIFDPLLFLAGLHL